MVKDKSYLTIQGWMLKELGLKGRELMAFAIIYGFSQDGAGWYIGGRSYIAEWLGCNQKTAGKILQDLTMKGVIEKKRIRDDTWPINRYRVPERIMSQHDCGEHRG